MLFRSWSHEGIRNGSITLTFRRWSRPQARAGGRYRLDAAGAIDIATVDTLPAAAITAVDARRAGYESRAALLADLERGRTLGLSDIVYRIRFRYIAIADPRTEVATDDALSPADIARLAARLAHMDQTSRHGPWTAATLRMIEAHPRVRAAQLAEQAGRPRLDFKRDLRKLKALGLTISHEVGYELSPRGHAFLRAVKIER